MEVKLFDGEEQMMEDYELFMKFMKEWKSVSSFTRFLSSDIAQTHLKVHQPDR